MSRVLFGIEKGLRVFGENSQTSFVDFLFGSGAPGGDSGDQDAASIGSLYARTNGTLYQKIATDNLTSDWTQFDASVDTSSASATGVTTAVTVDSVLVDDIAAVKWYVQVFEEATPANKQIFEVFAGHDGTAMADAVNIDDTIYSKLNLGSAFNLTISVDLNGTGGSQELRLRAASTSAGVTVKSRRETVLA